MTPLMLVQLYAVRATVDALIAAAEAEMPGRAEAGQCPKCKATGDAVQATRTVAGGTRMRCLSCGEEWDG